uniref:Uncharacterized protein n=1 Tax=Anguilla anguilla TaxID=7936 RepID=A0A0E9WF44_ANGAN
MTTFGVKLFSLCSASEYFSYYIFWMMKV